MSRALLISVTFNAALLGVCGWSIIRSTGLETRGTTVQEVVSETVPAAPAFQAAPSGVANPAEPALRPPSTSGVEGDVGLIAELKALGWPEDEARTFAIGRLFEEALDIRLGAKRERDYWEGIPRAESRQAVQEGWRLVREMTELIYDSSLAGDPGPLPPEKMAAIRQVAGDYAFMHRQFDPLGVGISLPEDYEVREKLLAEQRRDIEALLTPDELLEYEMRFSRSANRVRSSFSDIELTEEEFRALVRLQQEHDKAEPIFNPYPDDETGQRRMEASERLQLELQALLDEERYQQYRRNCRGEYQELLRLGDRLNLPYETVNQVFDRTEDALRARNDLVTSGAPYSEWSDPVQRLGDELRTELIELLGEDGLRLYHRHGGRGLSAFPSFRE